MGGRSRFRARRRRRFRMRSIPTGWRMAATLVYLSKTAAEFFADECVAAFGWQDAGVLVRRPHVFGGFVGHQAQPGFCHRGKHDCDRVRRKLCSWIWLNRKRKELAPLEEYAGFLTISPSAAKIAYFRNGDTLEVRDVGGPAKPVQVRVAIGQFQWDRSETSCIAEARRAAEVRQSGVGGTLRRTL